MMSQAIRRSGRVTVPVPQPALWAVDSLRKATRNSMSLNQDQIEYMSYGRVMDTTECAVNWALSRSGPRWKPSTITLRGRGLTDY